MQAKQKSKPQMIVTINKARINRLDRLSKSENRNRSSMIRHWIDTEYQKKFSV